MGAPPIPMPWYKWMTSWETVYLIDINNWFISCLPFPLHQISFACPPPLSFASPPPFSFAPPPGLFGLPPQWLVRCCLIFSSILFYPSSIWIDPKVADFRITPPPSDIRNFFFYCYFMTFLISYLGGLFLKSLIFGLIRIVGHLHMKPHQKTDTRGNRTQITPLVQCSAYHPSYPDNTLPPWD